MFFGNKNIVFPNVLTIFAHVTFVYIWHVIVVLQKQAVDVKAFEIL